MINQLDESGNSGGVIEIYNYLGILDSAGEYRNWERVGPWIEYRMSGNILYKGEYKAGVPHGFFEHYNQDGDISSLGRYKNNTPVGLWYEEKYTK